MNTDRNKIRLILFFISALLIHVCILCINNKDIKISHDSGFYDNDFYLKIQTRKNIKIYYTLDCSKPTINDRQYTSPILIKDSSQNKNFYSARNDLYIEYTKQNAKSIFNQNEQIPTSPVDKCTVIRLGYYDKDNKYLGEDYRIYFINYKQKRGYKNLYIISIITEPENLIDNKHGILVLGDKITNNKKLKTDSYLIKKANFFQKGNLWTKHANIDLFNEDRKHIFAFPATIRIRGGMRRIYSQKSIEVKFSSQNKKFILYNCGNDIVHKIRDYAVQNLESRAKSNFLTLKMYPCILFLNGEYWGVYYIMQDYDKQYFSKKDIIFIDSNKMQNQYNKNVNDFNDIKNFIAKNDMKNAKNYKKAAKYIDIDSFVDYYSTEIYIANADWGVDISNYALWKPKNRSEKWRFALYDVNDTGVLAAYKADTIKRTIDNDPIFRALIKNKDVQLKFKKRFNELEKIYSVENFIELYNGWYATMKEPLIKNHQRFFGDKDIEKKINDDKMQIVQFLKYRKEYIDKYMELHFD